LIFGWDAESNFVCARYNPESKAWSTVSVAQEGAPAELYNVKGFYVNNYLILFGGENPRSTRKFDFYSLRLSDGVWMSSGAGQPDFAGDSDALFAVHSSNLHYLRNGNLYSYDPTTNNWSPHPLGETGDAYAAFVGTFGANLMLFKQKWDGTPTKVYSIALNGTVTPLPSMPDSVQFNSSQTSLFGELDGGGVYYGPSGWQSEYLYRYQNGSWSKLKHRSEIDVDGRKSMYVGDVLYSLDWGRYNASKVVQLDETLPPTATSYSAVSLGYYEPLITLPIPGRGLFFWGGVMNSWDGEDYLVETMTRGGIMRTTFADEFQ
jgi:hypothetical protein